MTPTLPTMEANLERMYKRTLACPNCNPKRAKSWYVRYHRMIKASAEHYGKDVDRAYAVFALLSQQKSIAANCELYTLWLMDELPSTGILQNARIARIDSGQDIDEVMTFSHGLKLRSFWINLAHPWARDGVSTNDRHHIRIVFDDPDRVTCTLAQYRKITEATVNVATRLGMLAKQLQSLLWEHQRLCESR